MVQIRVKSLFFIIALIISLLFIHDTNGQSRVVSVDLQISAKSINRFIASQSFPAISGTAAGYTYNITITKPYITLNSNSAMASFTIKANTSAGNFSYTVTPTVSIPALNISVSQITGIIQQFETMINSRSDIPSWLKPIIINGYNNLNLTMYPSKVLDFANSGIPDYVDLQVTDIALSLSIVPGALNISASTTVVGTPPVFTAKWLKRGPWKASLKFGGSVATTIKQVAVYNGNGVQLYKNENLDLSSPKGGFCDQINIDNVDVSRYYIRVLFHSPYGEYARIYSFIFDTATYNTWFSTTLNSSIN